MASSPGPAAPKYEWQWNRLVEIKADTDTTKSTRAWEGAKAVGGGVATGVTGLVAGTAVLAASVIAIPGAAIVGAIKGHARETVENTADALGTIVDKPCSALWSWAKEKGRCTKDGIAVEKAMGTVLPGEEFSKLSAHARPPVDINDTISIQRHFAARREAGDTIPADEEVNYIVDLRHGIVVIEDTSTNPPTYEGFSVSNAKSGKPLTEKLALIRAARTIIATRRAGGEAAASFDKFDMVVFNVNNMGGDKSGTSLMLRGFTYSSRDKAKPDGWDPTKPLLEKGPNGWFSDGYGKEIKFEDSLKNELGRIMGLVDGEKLQGTKGGSTESAARAKSAAAKEKSAELLPPGMRKVNGAEILSDGECGYRALEMGRQIAAHKHTEESAQREFNMRGKTDFLSKTSEGVTTGVRVEIFNRLMKNVTDHQNADGTQWQDAEQAKVELEKIATSLRDEHVVIERRLTAATTSTNPKPALIAQLQTQKVDYESAIDALETAITDITTDPVNVNKASIDNVNNCVSSPFTKLAQEGGIWLTELSIAAYAKRHGCLVRRHHYNDAAKGWDEVAEIGNRHSKIIIDLLYTDANNGATGHYSLLRPLHNAKPPKITEDDLEFDSYPSSDTDLPPPKVFNATAMD